MMQARTATSTIFNTIPSHDYLGLFQEENPKKVVDFLHLTKDDVAKATGVPKISVRYDERIPEELIQRLLEISIVCELVAGYFEGNARKTALWFQIKNPALGNISPRDMIRLGRYQKLMKFIQDALSGSTP